MTSDMAPQATRYCDGDRARTGLDATEFLPVYCVWEFFVVVGFALLFDFV